MVVASGIRLARIPTTLALLVVACGDGDSIGGGWYSGTRTSLSMDDRGAKGTLIGGAPALSPSAARLPEKYESSPAPA